MSFTTELYAICRVHADSGTMTATARHPDKEEKAGGNLAEVPESMDEEKYALAAAAGFGPRMQKGGMGAKARLSGIVATNVVRALLAGASAADLRAAVNKKGKRPAGQKKAPAAKRPQVKRPPARSALNNGAAVS